MTTTEACPHYQCVSDNASGDVICTACGLVTESIPFASQCTWEDGFDVVPISVNADISDSMRRRYVKLEPHISTVCTVLSIPQHIKETARSLAYELLRSTITVREQTARAFSAALVYQACKLHDVDRSESEFVSNNLASSKDLAHANKRLRRELAQHIEHRATNPGKLVQRFINLLCQDFDSRSLALLRSKTEDIIRQVLASGVLDGKTPECACATCLALAVRYVPRVKDVDAFIRLLCERCGLTYGTITNTLRLVSVND